MEQEQEYIILQDEEPIVITDEKQDVKQEKKIDDLHIILILDESGSMDNIRTDIIGSVNSFIREQKEMKSDETKITFIKFNSVVSHIYEKKLLSEMPELTSEYYKPNHNTALFDAIGIALTNYSDLNTCVIIVTDGQENASKNFTRNKMIELIEDKKKLGWNFVYLSADLSQMKQAENIGIHTTAFGTTNTLTQNVVSNYKDLGYNIRTKCNNVVKELRTTGQMSGLGTH
jgi:hypothetical protein